MNRVELYMVQAVEVVGNCNEGFPCKHECKITLMDGREKTVKINGNDLRTLSKSTNFIDKIDKDGKNHFYKYDLSLGYERGIPQSIISTIFQNETT